MDNKIKRIMQWNIRSALSNKDDLMIFLDEYKPDVVVLNETWLKPNLIFNVKGFFYV